MSADLPGPLQQIVDFERNRPADPSNGPVQHHIEFATGSRHIASFESSGPMLVPTTGQTVTLHGVRVTVVEVDTAYEVTESGAQSVYTTVTIVPAA